MSTTTVKPKLYIKQGCPWCMEAEDFLQDHGIAYDVLEVRSNRAAYDEMVALSGQTKAPVMDWDGEVLADFGAEELGAFLKQRGVIK
ncbi:NrdH-redoxin [Verrucomicrobia bacterium LW23]|nr:NrdH-redoxin [Verrucomicrobia bacterium LW23]